MPKCQNGPSGVGMCPNVAVILFLTLFFAHNLYSFSWLSIIFCNYGEEKTLFSNSPQHSSTPPPLRNGQNHAHLNDRQP